MLAGQVRDSSTPGNSGVRNSGPNSITCSNNNSSGSRSSNGRTRTQQSHRSTFPTSAQYQLLSLSLSFLLVFSLYHYILRGISIPLVGFFLLVTLTRPSAVAVAAASFARRLVRSLYVVILQLGPPGCFVRAKKKNVFSFVFSMCASFNVSVSCHRSFTAKPVASTMTQHNGLGRTRLRR